MAEDEGHTNNDDLRMMGLEGDNEDGLEDDRAHGPLTPGFLSASPTGYRRKTDQRGKKNL
ncbi:hypothetical protein C2845_PM09G04870 [Panicum miliaceum]|uniref:Uncharacterized protein n=1 Tax=Panicum miliaceum TaxID=4540 RepID=A0A3L6S1E2_PANMI|nr:hypothetical protein C2845_PM09G04870 [Panicum miliaceum]